MCDTKDLSNKIGIHVYPIHALQFSTRFGELHHLKLLRKLQHFTIVHSKFILLLQSLAHSSLRPLEPEPEDNSPSRLTLQTPPPGIKQLHFPEPLCYIDSPAIHRTPSYHRHKRSQSARIVTGSSKALGKRRSVLGRPKSPPPPPSSDFLVRQSYFSPLRRTFDALSSIGTSEPSSSRRRRFHNASNLSISSLSTTTRLSMVHEKRSSMSIPRLRIPLQSPHDIHFATSRSRAPILRVFVPCSELTVSIAECEDQLIDAGLWDHLSTGDIVCNLGYMPPVPTPERDFSRDYFGDVSPSMRSVRSQPSSFGNRATDDAVWLVYDGFGLVQYSPVLQPPPLKDALTLVTPYYYSHILQNSANPFFTLDLYTRLSGFRRSVNGAGGNTFSPPALPKFELVALLTKVRSPKSPGGYAMVRRYKWIAAINGIKAAVSGDLEVGNGWLTDEWVLEADGTVEGRRMLDSLLSSPGAYVASDWARGDWVWEIDKQRSNPSKTWFRSVHFQLALDMWTEANSLLSNSLLGSSEDYVLPLDPGAIGPPSTISTVPFHTWGSAAGKRRQLSFMAR